MRRARLFSLLLCFAVAAAPLHAQWQFSGDVGASRLQRTAIPQANAVTVGANATTVGDRSWLRSSLLGVVAGPGQTTGQGLVAGSLLGPDTRPLRGEIT